MRLRRELQSTITKWLNSEIADQLKGAVFESRPFSVQWSICAVGLNGSMGRPEVLNNDAEYFDLVN